MKRSASVQWVGSLKEGDGKINTESGSLSQLPYSFAKRFGEENGTNPEELIAAAHASCFAMAISAELDKGKFVADTIDIKADVSLNKEAQAWTIDVVHLNVSLEVPGATDEQVKQFVTTAKENCPVSKLLNAKITMDLSIRSSNNLAHR